MLTAQLNISISVFLKLVMDPSKCKSGQVHFKMSALKVLRDADNQGTLLVTGLHPVSLSVPIIFGIFPGVDEISQVEPDNVS